MPSQFGHRSRRHGNVLLEKIQGQLADGVDLMGVGVLQQVLALVPIGFVQDALKEWPLALEAFHRENGRHQPHPQPFIVVVVVVSSFRSRPPNFFSPRIRRRHSRFRPPRPYLPQPKEGSRPPGVTRLPFVAFVSGVVVVLHVCSRVVWSWRRGPLSLYGPGSGMGLVMPSGAFGSQTFATFFSSELQTQFDGSSQSAQ